MGSTARLRAAEDLLVTAKRSPKEALIQGEDLVSAAQAAGDSRSLAVALRAMGDAARYAASLDESIALLERSVAAAAAAGDRGLLTESQLTLAGSQAIAGDMDLALETLDACQPGGDERLAAEVLSQRGAVLARAGRQQDAIDALDDSIPTLEVEDHRLAALALQNRGRLHAFSGDFAVAAEDLGAARNYAEELGMESVAAGIDHSLGVVASYKGDLPEAIACFNRAEAAFQSLTGTPFESQVARCEVLLSAGLFTDALALATNIRSRMHEMGLGADAVEATLVMAHAALLGGDLEGAVAAAKTARSLLEGKGRPGWEAVSGYTMLRALAAAGDRTATPRLAREVAAQLDQAGQFIPAGGALLLATRLSLEAGDVAEAEASLSELERRTRGPFELRVKLLLARALIRRARGDERGADAAARAGVRLLAEHQHALGATDVRVGVAKHGEELGALGLAIAARSGNARRIWTWMERTRAGAMRFRPVRPPADDEAAEVLARLRLISSKLRDASPGEAEHLERRQTQLQRELLQRGHELAGGAGDIPRAPAVAEVADALGDRSLVELAFVGETVLAVTIRRGRVRQVELGSVRDVLGAFGSVRLALARLMRNASEQNRELVEAAAGRLAALLLIPLRVGEEDLVVVPPAALMSIPWSLLMPNPEQAVTVAPAASVWLGRQERSLAAGTVLVAGPGLEFATAEVRDLATVYPRARRFPASKSRVAEVLAALDGARVAHLATHGRFRTDNALFSSLELADGDLNVLDLETLARAPELIVLSACESGLSAAKPGDELLGLSAALLAVGAQSLIASVGLVPDSAATRRLVRSFHERVAAGATPARALAAARASVSTTPTGYAASAAFSCFGGG